MTIRSKKSTPLYHSKAVLHLSPTRWMLYTFGFLLPEVSSGVLVYKTAPWLSILLFAGAVSTLGFILTFLRRQSCRIRILSEKIEVKTARSKYYLRGKDFFDCTINEKKQVVLRHRDEIQVLEVKDSKAFHSAFQKMISNL